MVSLEELIDHGFYPFLLMVYNVLITNYYILESIYYIYRFRSVLEENDDYGEFWR